VFSRWIVTNITSASDTKFLAFLAGIISWSAYCTGHAQMLMTREVPSAARACASIFTTEENFPPSCNGRTQRIFRRVKSSLPTFLHFPALYSQTTLIMICTWNVPNHFLIVVMFIVARVLAEGDCTQGCCAV
jgi:hypothetical protein